MAQEKTITLRSVNDSDEDFLLSVYGSSRAEELAQVPWSAEQKDAFVQMQFSAQTRHYAAEYPQAAHQIICADGTPVGRIYFDQSESAFHILDITVLPAHRNRGIGSFVLRQLLEEARMAGKPVTIYVENFNPSLSLFTRLGFQRAEENGFQLLLKKFPVAKNLPCTAL
jgi:ribosomal protein S18 acetylase RimI-like enzyme